MKLDIEKILKLKKKVAVHESNPVEKESLRAAGYVKMVRRKCVEVGLREEGTSKLNCHVCSMGDEKPSFEKCTLGAEIWGK